MRKRKNKKATRSKDTIEIPTKTVTLEGFRSKLLELHRNLDEPILEKLNSLVQCMWKLTGYIIVKRKDSKEYPATCFLQRICYKRDMEKEYAVFTFTTAYHTFGEKQDTSYILTGEFHKLCRSVTLYLDQEVPLKLTDFTLVETDKEYFYKNDWCAIECKCYEMEKVEELKDCLDRYQDLQKDIYNCSKELVYKDINIVIVVGYPDNKKRVSIGKHFRELKEVLKEVRSGQRWCRYYYDAPTWPGSSGSPIYIFGQPIAGFGYWFGHPHNHAKATEVTADMKKKVDKGDVQALGEYVGISSIGVEQID